MLYIPLSPSCFILSCQRHRVSVYARFPFHLLFRPWFVLTISPWFFVNSDWHDGDRSSLLYILLPVFVFKSCRSVLFFSKVGRHFWFRNGDKCGQAGREGLPVPLLICGWNKRLSGLRFISVQKEKRWRIQDSGRMNVFNAFFKHPIVFHRQNFRLDEDRYWMLAYVSSLHHLSDSSLANQSTNRSIKSFQTFCRTIVRLIT